MILSLHPLLSADENILCAGRKPDDSDQKAIEKANAVALPLGCKKELYFMAKKSCKFVFPNYELSSGGEIEYNTKMELVRSAERSLGQFVGKTGINLAGFDFLFSKGQNSPLMIEINYFFGKRGLGGSRKFNQILWEEINRWLVSIGTKQKICLEDFE